MADKSEYAAQVVGHMVRFLPREEKPHRSGNATTILHPKVAAFVLVVADDPHHYHTLAHRQAEVVADEDPGLAVTEPLMETLRKDFPYGSTITIYGRKDPRTKSMRFSLEKHDRY